MRNTLWEKRIPTLFGIIIIIGSIIATSTFLGKNTIFIGNASAAQTPHEIRITNITQTSFSVSYTTDQSVLGSISFGENKNMKSIAIDDRDQTTNISKPYQTHHITIKNLNPKTTYFLEIVSGENTYLDNTQPFKTTTASEIPQQTAPQYPISGKILFQENDTSSQEAIVYIKTSLSQTISTLVRPDGSYMLSTISLRTNDEPSYLSLNQKTTLQMFVKNNSSRSNVVLFLSQGKEIPPIILSKDYDFTTNNLALPVQIASSSAGFGFLRDSATEVEKKGVPQIISPKKDESFSDLKPLFKGTAPVESTVTITINSENPIQTQVKTDKNGNWIYRPSENLLPGNHTITIKAKDKLGIIKTITQSFTVYAQGGQFTEPSVSPSQTTPTPIATTIPSPTITLPSPSPTPLPTLIPSPTPFSQNPPFPPPGNSYLPIISGISLVVTFASLAIFFLI